MKLCHLQRMICKGTVWALIGLSLVLLLLWLFNPFFCSSICLLGLEKKQSEETDIDKESPVSRLVLSWLVRDYRVSDIAWYSYPTVSRFQHLRPAVLHQPEEDEDGDFESAGFSTTLLLPAHFTYNPGMQGTLSFLMNWSSSQSQSFLVKYRKIISV